MKIGIGITTHNRNNLCDQTVTKINRLLPPNCKVIIVDDASARPYRRATFRFNTNVGAPMAKNKCLELLKDCDHIFLFDDDTAPVKRDWWVPYIQSPEHHLCYTFKYPHQIINGHRVSDNPNGCMMYISNKCLETIGGFDTEFKMYGYWHANYSLRAHNAGLTSHPFMDVEDRLFKCLDETGRNQTSRPDRARYIESNRRMYHAKIKSKEYIDFVCAPPRVWYLTPYGTDGNIGREYNEQIALLPKDDWVCLRDGDTCFTTPDSLWGVQIADIIKKHGSDFELIGCYTNRLASPKQCHNGEFSDNGDWTYHKSIGSELYEKHYSDVEAVNHNIAGMFMLFPKRIWEKVKFKEDAPYRIFDTDFCQKVKRARGRIGMARGIYLFHDYRWGKENPKQNTAHLK